MGDEDRTQAVPSLSDVPEHGGGIPPAGGYFARFHLPRPPHGWTAFLYEIGVVVIGILIALGLEQAVQWVDRRSEVSQAEEAIRTEMNNNLWAVEETRKGDACADQRLALLRRWANGEVQINSAHLSALEQRQLLWLLWDPIWEATKNSGTVSHFPVARRLQYAGIYGWVTILKGFRATEATAWAALARYQGKEKLTPAEAARLKEDIATLEVAAVSRRNGYERLTLALKAIKAKPVRPSQVTLSFDPQALCRLPPEAQSVQRSLDPLTARSTFPQTRAYA